MILRNLQNSPQKMIRVAMSMIVVGLSILAIGITGNVEDVGLEGTKVKVEKCHVLVDQWLQTGEPGVYAIGDLVGAPWLAHKASHEGVICVEKIAGLEHVQPLNVLNIPGCTYCTPQVASVGLTEAKAKEGGRKLKVGRFPYIGNGKAIALGEPEGMSISNVTLRDGLNATFFFAADASSLLAEEKPTKNTIIAKMI